MTARFERASAGVVVGRRPGIEPSGSPSPGAAFSARAGCGSFSKIEFGVVGHGVHDAQVTIVFPASHLPSQGSGFVYTPPSGTTTCPS